MTKHGFVLQKMVANATAQAGEKNARLTATPDFAPGVNPVGEIARGKAIVESLASEKQVATPQEFMKESGASTKIGTLAADGGAGYQELENPVNRSEVVVSEELTSELRTLLAELGVNQVGALLGRKPPTAPGSSPITRRMKPSPARKNVGSKSFCSGSENSGPEGRQ